MDVILLLKGIFSGFVIAAPVGPVGIMCAQRTLHRGFAIGVMGGAGAAVADTIFGAAAAFGLTIISGFLLQNETVMRLVGGVIMLGVGLHYLIRKATLDQPAAGRFHFAGVFLTTFVLTITNPITILSFSPVFLATGAVVPPHDIPAAWTLILGVFAGSWLWWFALCALVSLFRSKISHDGIRWINRISGGIIVFFGIVVLLSVTDFGMRVIGANLHW
ncbi:MAG: LysE family translocator [Alphaproteobacteria bacterium]